MTVEDHLSPGPAARLERISLAVLLTLTATVTYVVATGEGVGAPGGRLGGDLPAFITAGRLAADGNWASLYDEETQQTTQADLFEEEDRLLPFVYPPFVALAYQPLAAIPYRAAYLVHALLMGLALLAALLLIRPVFGWMQQLSLVVLFTASLTFYPLLRAVLGGQLSPVTLLLFAAVLRLEFEDRALAAGAAAGLLLFKPSYGVPLALLLVAGRRLRMLGGWAATAGALYAIGAVLMGPGWPAEWWAWVSGFAPRNFAANATHFVSVPGFVGSLFGEGAGNAALVVAALIFGLGAAAVWFAVSARPDLRVGTAAAVVIAIAPQAQFYDAGVLVLPVALLTSGAVSRRWLLLALAWLAGLLHLGNDLVGASPLALFVAAVTVLVFHRVRRSAAAAR